MAAPTKRRRADKVRTGQRIARLNGGLAEVVNVRRVMSLAIGDDIIELWLSTGEVMRRAPGAKLDVTAIVRRGRMK